MEKDSREGLMFSIDGLANSDCKRSNCFIQLRALGAQFWYPLLGGKP